MIDLSDVVFVWGASEGGDPAFPPTVSVSAWPHLFGKSWLRWSTNPPDTVQRAQVAFVNVFHTADSVHVEQIKRINPACYVIAMPDPSLDMVLLHLPEWLPMLRQLSLADAIGGRTKADCAIYGHLLNKLSVYLPSPIGPTEWFEPFRELPKEDYILTLDHAFAPPNTVYNVAALAAVQRHTGMRVVYASQRDYTPDLAKLAGLDAEFAGHVPFAEFVALTARARLCIDMYASHSYGRQQVLCAMVGTVCIGSTWCDDAPGLKVDPTNAADVVRCARNFLKETYMAEMWRSRGFDEVENFTFDVSRARLERILERVRVHA